MSVTDAGRGAVGAPLDRMDGPLKVRGAATYAYEWPVENPAYLYPLQVDDRRRTHHRRRHRAPRWPSPACWPCSPT